MSEPDHDDLRAAIHQILREAIYYDVILRVPALGVTGDLQDDIETWKALAQKVADDVLLDIMGHVDAHIGAKSSGQGSTTGMANEHLAI